MDEQRQATENLARLVAEVAEALRPMMEEAGIYCITIRPDIAALQGPGNLPDGALVTASHDADGFQYRTREIVPGVDETRSRRAGQTA
jgi:hypothetical protein